MKPLICLLWNWIKTGIDTFARYLYNVEAEHMRLSPLQKVYLTSIKGQIYNAFNTTKVFKSHDDLHDEKKNLNFRAYKENGKKNYSFSDFCYELSCALKKAIELDDPYIVGLTRMVDHHEDEENDIEIEESVHQKKKKKT